MFKLEISWTFIRHPSVTIGCEIQWIPYPYHGLINSINPHGSTKMRGGGINSQK